MSSTKDLSEIKLLIEKGLTQGYLTQADLIDKLPPELVNPEQIDETIAHFTEHGIIICEDDTQAPDVESVRALESLAPTEPEEDAEEMAAALAAAESELGRTSDPVRMYMREMGSVELLTRQGEIAIAQRIEEGIKLTLAALAQYPKIIDSILNEYRKVTRDEKRISDIISGFLDVEETVGGQALEAQIENQLAV